jgi:L-alanine-DL-glutamate epimerase-like enolase superfamily enzyme
MANRTGKGGFGDNPKNINKKGNQYKRAFDYIRALAQKIGDEKVLIDGNERMNAEWALRKLMHEDPMKFIEVGYGKVPQQIDLNIDFTSLSSEQLERIAKGEDVYRVIASKGTG